MPGLFVYACCGGMSEQLPSSQQGTIKHTLASLQKKN